MGKVQLKELHEQLTLDFEGRTVSGVLKAIKLIQDGHTVLYLPALKISGYGDDLEEAKEMVDETIQDYFDNLFKLPADQIKAEMISLGFASVNSYFRRPIVDIAGELKDFEFSIDENTVVHESIMELV